MVYVVIIIDVDITKNFQYIENESQIFRNQVIVFESGTYQNDVIFLSIRIRVKKNSNVCYVHNSDPMCGLISKLQH